MLIYFTFALILFGYTPIDKNDCSIQWCNNHLLEWSNFKGTPDKNSSFRAMADCGIHYNFKPNFSQDSIILSTNAIFCSSTSWVKSDTSLQLLMHERLHFDIAELYCRLFKGKLLESNLTFENYIFRIDSLHKSSLKELNVVQEKYDNETNHGELTTAQNEWANKVRDLLLNENLNKESEITLAIVFE